ncbi:PTS mannose/fructose/sorbose/N-acetylgalactosamine transporter subunit IIC [Caproiciproducens sp.]
MNNMTIALLLGLVCFLGYCDGKFLGVSMLDRPIVMGALTGLMMGNFIQGVIIGGTMELAWMGLLYYAGMVPADVTVGSIVGTYFALATGTGFEVAITIALPAGILGAYVGTAFNTIGSSVMHVCDKWAANGEIDRINRFHIIYGILKCTFMGLVVFFTILLGSDAIQALIKAIPENVLNGMNIASNMLPAVGFGMLINIMWDKRYIPLYFVGFVLAAYLKLNIMAITILILCIALFRMFTKKEEVTNA